MSKRLKSVLIVVDSFQREYLGAYTLSQELKRNGFKTRITSRYALESAYDAFHPGVVILPKTHKVPALEKIHRHSVVVLLQAESFSGNIEAFKSFCSRNSSIGIRPDLVDAVFCWGDFDYRFYQEAEIYPQAEIEVTGHPMVDIWYKPKKNRKTSEKPVIGISTSITCLTHITNSLGPVSLIDNIERNWESGLFEPPYHAEDRIAFEAAWIRIVIELIRAFKGHRIHLRPHPLEDVEQYRWLEKEGDVRIDNHQPMVDWSDEVDVLLSFISTSQLDAYLRGVKVVSIQNLFPKRILETLPRSLKLPVDHFFEAPETIEEIKRSVTAERVTSAKADFFLKDVFHFPTVKPSARVTQAVGALFEKESLFTQKAPFPSRSLIHSFLPSTFNLADLKTLYWDLSALFFGKGNPHVSYCKHRWFRNLKMQRLIHTEI